MQPAILTFIPFTTSLAVQMTENEVPSGVSLSDL